MAVLEILVALLVAGVTFVLWKIYSAANVAPSIQWAIGYHWFWGHFKKILSDDPIEAHWWPTRSALKHGGVCKMRFLYESYVTVADPLVASEVLHNDVTNYTHGAVYDFFRPWLGEGILCTEGQAWKWRRKLLNLCFSPAALREMYPMFVASAQRLVTQWEKHEPAESVDVMIDFVGLTLDTIGLAAFGYDFNAQNGTLSPISEAFRIVMHAQQERLKVGWMPLWLYRHTAAGKAFMSNCRYLREAVTKVVEARRRLSPEEQAKKNDVLSRLLAASLEGVKGEQYSDEQLRDEALTMVFAGHESTSSLLSFTLYEVSKRPEMQQRIVEEVDSVLQGRVPEYKDISRLPYLSQVMKEVLRMNCPVPGIGKRTLSEQVIGGHKVPADVDVDLTLLGCHHNPNYWPEPEKFDPERFSADSIKARPTNVYIPFATGPRNCLGQNFALLEVTTVLALLFQRYTFKPAPGFKLDIFTMVNAKPLDGVRLNIIRRPQPVA